MQSLSRRTLLGLMSTIFFIPKNFVWDNTSTLITTNNDFMPITIMGKFFREKRYDVINRFIDYVVENCPGMDRKLLEQTIIDIVKTQKNIHYLSVEQGHSVYYVHVHYIKSNECLAKPIV